MSENDVLGEIVPEEEVEPDEKPDDGSMSINPAAVLQILQVKAQNDPLLAAQLEAATYRAALETLRA